MKGFKGFAPGLVCLGKKYTENTVFEEEEARICSCGMHFCQNPFDVLDYYSLLSENGEFNEFAGVEALAEAKTDDKKKYCTTKLKISAKLSFADFIKACVDFIVQIGISGDRAQIGSSKNSAQIGSSGNYAKIGSSGNYAKIGSSGDYAQIGSSGNYAKIVCKGTNSVICCAGSQGIVKAEKGCWITLSEWKFNNEQKCFIPVCVKTEYVDGEKIRAGVAYKLIGGEFIEAER